MKLETAYKTEFVNDLRKNNGWYARRIEDKFAVGVPDIMLGIPFGPAVLIEAKRVEGGKFAPTPRQLIDLREWEHNAKSLSVYSPHYRIAGVLGFDGVTCYIGAPAELLRVQECLAKGRYESNADFIVRYWNKRLME